MLTRAMILAAGTGTRLQPLTDEKPKALLKFQGKTMLEHVISQITGHGIKDIIVNVHHHADQIITFVKNNNYFGINISFSDEREQLMDTGGGILKAQWFLDGFGPFLVHNVDIFSDIDLKKYFKAHAAGRAIATLAVTDRKSSRNLLIDKENRLCGWENKRSGEKIISIRKTGLRGLAFSGVHIIDPEIFTLIENKEPFSMTTAYLELAGTRKILTYEHSGDTWIDMAHQDNFRELI
jgi:NDP-sugar pyrophosphorylase family protein